MESSGRGPWLRAAFLVGVVYLLDSLVTNVFDRWVPAGLVRPVRLASWLVAGVAFAAHIGYERFRLGSRPLATALHVATGVALGAFAVAAVGLLRGQGASEVHQQRMVLALVLWPVVVGAPAFLVALAAASMLARARR